VRSTAEQQEAKRKEKEKKLQIYRSTVANIFQKVSQFLFAKMLQYFNAIKCTLVCHLVEL